MQNPDKKTSTVSMNLTSSSGTWLNGCLQPQHYYVSLNIEDPNGEIVARVALSYEQAAKMMLYNGDVECTLERYRDKTGNLTEEKVEPPETVHQRMKDRLKDSHVTLAKRLEDIRRDVYEMLNGGKSGKTNLTNLLHDIEVIQGHYSSNENFVVQQAEEELGSMQNNAAGQLGLFLQSHGADLKQEDLLQMLPVSSSQLAITDKAEPVKDEYKMKQREDKSIEDMTAMEVADRIHKLLKKFESLQPDKGSEKAHLFGSGAFMARNKVSIKYISYQGTSILELDEAKAYLKFLLSVKDLKQFKRHFNFA